MKDNKGPVIKMVQVMPTKWELQAPNGAILKKDIICGNLTEALEYARAYASSFNDWSVEVIPLKKLT